MPSLCLHSLHFSSHFSLTSTTKVRRTTKQSKSQPHCRTLAVVCCPRSKGSETNCARPNFQGIVNPRTYELTIGPCLMKDMHTHTHVAAWEGHKGTCVVVVQDGRREVMDLGIFMPKVSIHCTTQHRSRALAPMSRRSRCATVAIDSMSK